MRWAAAAVWLAGCSFDPRGLTATGASDAGADATRDAHADARVDATVDADLCPAGYAPLPGIASRSQYRVETSTKQWTDAEAGCEADGLAHLVVLDDDAERDAVRGTIGGDMWTGVTDRVSEGTFFKVTTGLATYLPWLSGEPNNQGNEDCVELVGGGMNDESCSHSRVSVCECDGAAANPVAYTPP